MKTLQFMLAILILVLGPYNTFAKGTNTGSSKTANKKTEKKKLSWKKYHAVCGMKNKSREKNFDKVKGTNIFWIGKVAEITKDLALTDHRKWMEKVIRLKMEPSESLVADIRLRIPKALTTKMEKVEKGQYLGVKGKIMHLGTRLGDHVVEVENFKRMKPKPKKDSTQ